MSDQRNDLYKEIEQLVARAPIKCVCGNAQWKEFLYVGSSPEWIAGCKRCGSAYRIDGNAWELKTRGPLAPGGDNDEN